jgi:hypothetical protein
MVTRQIQVVLIAMKPVSTLVIRHLIPASGQVPQLPMTLSSGRGDE